MTEKYVITISRQYGSGGREIGRRLAEALGVKYYNKELLSMAAEESGLCKDFIRNSLVDVPTNKFWYALAINPQALLLSPDGGCVTGDMANKALSEAVNAVAGKRILRYRRPLCQLHPERKTPRSACFHHGKL